MSNPMKSEIRATAVHDVGLKLDDMLDGLKVQVSQAEGKISAAQIIYNRLVALTSHVDVDVTEGKLDLETASKIKLYLARAQAVAEVTGREFANERMRSVGAVSGVKAAVEATKKIYDREKQASAVVQEEPVSEPVASVPQAPRSLKEIRLAEAVAAAMVTAAKSFPEQASPAVLELLPEKELESVEPLPEKKTNGKVTRKARSAQNPR